MLQTLLLRVEVFLAIASAIAVFKSTYNGWVRRHIIQPLDMIQEVGERAERLEENQQKIAERQERQIDATIALVESHDEDMDFDLDRYRNELRGNGGPNDFLNGD